MNKETTPENGRSSVPLDKIVSRLFALIYEDDGPNGICGQSCSITSKWKRLYLFETEEKMREFSRNIEEDRARKNSRVTYAFYPDPLGYQDINFISG